MTKMTIELLEQENERLRRIITEQFDFQCKRQAPTMERIREAHSFLNSNWPFTMIKDNTEKHHLYRQSYTEDCYICTLLELTEKQKVLIQKLLGTNDDKPTGSSPTV